MKALGKTYKDAEASMGGEFPKLPAGGYVCRILSVEDKADKEYLEIVYDIAEGEYKGFFSDEWGKQHPYAHRLIRSYKEKALGMFKGFLVCVDKSNGTNFAEAAAKGLPEQQLVGKLVGMVIGYEEYAGTDGTIRQRSYVSANRSVDAIKNGEFKVPELKRIEDPVNKADAAPVDGFSPLGDIDCPF